MNIRTINNSNKNIAVISSSAIIIKNGQDALDLITKVRYDHGCDSMIINKKNIAEDFFDLKSGIAGEIMQKYINYDMILAIVGEFDSYNSKSLKSLIYESNKLKKIVFTSTEKEALKVLGID
jgi:hypothetical protein